MISGTNKKDFFYIVVLILTFITFLVGMAFAIYTWFFSHPEGSSSVYTGTLTIEYSSSNIVNVDSLYPISKPKFTDTNRLYRNTFKVKNTGSLDGIVSISIDFTLNQFSDNTLKYVLYTSQGDEIVEGYLNGTDSIILAENIAIASEAEEEYVLMIWLNESDDDQNTEMRKVLIGAIDVNATQQID